MADILSYGIYIPRYRLRYEEIRNAWKNKEYLRNTGITQGVLEKAVPRYDEDAVTISIETARNTLKNSQIDLSEIGAIIVGSASNPTKGKGISSILAKALGCNSLITIDINQGSKSGTSALLMGKALVESENVRSCLVIASDCLKAEPGGELEPFLGAGGAGFLLGKKGAVEISSHEGYAEESFDLWCREEERFLQLDRDMYRDSLAKAIIPATRNLMAKLRTNPSDYQYAIFQQLNQRDSERIGRELGFERERLKDGMLVRRIGETFSASTLIGLNAVLDKAKKGEKILLASYGSASADAFHLEVKEETPNLAQVEEFLRDTIYLDYTTYLRYSDLLCLTRPEDELEPQPVEVLNRLEHIYKIQRYECKNCGWGAVVERKVCPNCYSQDWKTYLLTDRGKIWSLTQTSAFNNYHLASFRDALTGILNLTADISFFG